MQQVWHGSRNEDVPRLHARTRHSETAAHGNGRVIRLAVAATLFIVGAATAAFAAPPPDIKPDPALELWFKSLQQPSSQRLCCSVSDCRFVEFWVHAGRYEVEIDGWRY